MLTPTRTPGLPSTTSSQPSKSPFSLLPCAQLMAVFSFMELIPSLQLNKWELRRRKPVLNDLLLVNRHWHCVITGNLHGDNGEFPLGTQLIKQLPFLYHAQRALKQAQAQVALAGEIRLNRLAPSGNNDNCAFQLFVKTPTATDPLLARALPFPLSAESLNVIKSQCSPATFGVGGETRLDPSVRRALSLSPSHFSCSWDLGSTNILHLIRQLLKPDVSEITAELYKLNVYEEGGHFSSHVDTPRGERFFGSLVVCLPSPFTGGNLHLQHRSQHLVFDWSTASEKQRESRILNSSENKFAINSGGDRVVCGAGSGCGMSVRWCAFYGDCRHWIDPVLSGNRLTLTYNLYRGTQLDPQAQLILASAFPRLQSFLGQYLTRFESERLGFYCTHFYPHTSQNCSSTLSVADLKGVDAAVHAIACNQGRQCLFLPVLFDDYVCAVQGDPIYVLPTFSPVLISGIRDDYMDEEWKEQRHKVKGERKLIIHRWINSPPAQELLEKQEHHAFFGNEASVGTTYSAALLVISPRTREGEGDGEERKEERDEDEDQDRNLKNEREREEDAKFHCL